MSEKENRSVEEKEEIGSYGGYLTRHEYEKRREKTKNMWLRALYIALVVVLLLPASLGVIGLVRGDFYPEEEAESAGEGTIRVPSQAQLSQTPKEAEEALRTLDSSLATVEAVKADGTIAYGTGFVISEEGHLLCSSTLAESATRFRIHLSDMNVTATMIGVEKSLGIALLKLDGAYGLSFVSVGNFSFVERGENLTAVGAVYGNDFLGTALTGNVAVIGTPLRVEVGKSTVSVPVAFLSVSPNESIFGAPCIDEAGNTVGICTNVIEAPYGDLTAVVSINAVYTLVNEMLAETV